MPYATVEQVQEEFKAITFSTTTAVKTAQVERFITEADAEINLRVGTRYVLPLVPASSPNATAILRMICINLVAQRVKNLLEVKNAATDAEQDVRPDSAREARKMLDSIVAQKLVLDMTLLSASGGIESFATTNCGVEHTFKKGVDQW